MPSREKHASFSVQDLIGSFTTRRLALSLFGALVGISVVPADALTRGSLQEQQHTIRQRASISSSRLASLNHRDHSRSEGGGRSAAILKALNRGGSRSASVGIVTVQRIHRGAASHATGRQSSEPKQKSKPASKSNAALGRGSRRRPPNDASTFPWKRDNPKSAAKTRFAPVGLASFYTEGAETANGERFNTYDLTAAHLSLPFDTRLRVTSVATGRSVIVRINDRGPFLSERVVDVSYSAAEALGMVEEGIAQVKLDIVR
jgi:rare lipoprotein A